jgi:hypothetical protein
VTHDLTVIEDAGRRGFLGDPIVSGATCGMTIAGIVAPAATCPGAGRALEALNGAVTASTSNSVGEPPPR